MTRSVHLSSAVGLLAILVPTLVLGTFLLRRYLQIKTAPAILIGVASALVTIALGFSMDWSVIANRRINSPAAFLLLSVSVFSAIAILSQLYRKWISGNFTEREKLPGGPGFQAWFHWGNLVFAAVFSGATYFMFDIPLPILLFISLGAFAAYPIFTTISVPDQPEPASPSRSTSDNSDLNADRERVLNMLEQGKISPDEGAELLQAIGVSSLPNHSPSIPPAKQKLLLMGGTLVLFGFLLPWFSFDSADQYSEILRSTTFPGFEQLAEKFSEFKGVTVHINGGDIKHGLGWIILFAGLGVAVMSLIPQTIEESTRKTLSLLLLGVGGIILLYLLTAEFRHISFGVPLVIVGYVLLAAASFRKTALSPQPSLSPSIQES